jgi:hypothetical protein
MTWVMDDKEFEAVFSLPAQRRYAYLLKRVVDWERIWSLGTQEGWALSPATMRATNSSLFGLTNASPPRVPRVHGVAMSRKR